MITAAFIQLVRKVVDRTKKQPKLEQPKSPPRSASPSETLAFIMDWTREPNHYFDTERNDLA